MPTYEIVYCLVFEPCIRLSFSCMGIEGKSRQKYVSVCEVINVIVH